MLASLEADKPKYDPAEFRIKQQRLRQLLKVQSRIRKILPLVEKVLG
jgi:hypothetical protein